MSLKFKKTSVEVQKIDDSIIKFFRIVIAYFQVKDKVDKFKYFLKIYLVANTKVNIVLGILFLKLSNIDMLFGDNILTRLYSILNISKLFIIQILS